MEKLVLTIGGLIETLEWSDLFFFLATLVLLLLLIYIVFLLRFDEEENNSLPKLDEKKTKTLEEIVDKLESEYKPEPIDLSAYEQEMENTAIISYDELLERTSTKLNFVDDYDAGIEGITVKMIDPTNTSMTEELVDLPKAVMMNYESEEAFLKALKVLQSNLVR